MNLDNLLDAVTPDVYTSLKRAVELGKWDNGIKLTQEQISNSLQIIIAYDERHKPESERVGYVAPKPHTHCEKEPEEQEWQALRINNAEPDES